MQEQNDSLIARRKLEKLSRIMDSSIRLPGGYTIGWDGIIGLIPGVGDLAGMGISLYILVSAGRLGASKVTLLRMLANIGLETTVGAIPVVGDLFDLAYKANSRNMRILDKQLLNSDATHSQSSRWLMLCCLVALAVFLMCGWLMLTILMKLFS